MADALFSRYFADGDFELGGYRLQALHHEARQAFRRNAVFPHLNQVQELAQAMRGVLNELYTLRGAHPDSFGPGFAEDHAGTTDVLHATEAFAHWACELLEPLAHEGKTLLQFAQEHVHLAPVGVQPARAHEGYLLVEQHQSWRAYRFSAYVLRAADEAELHAEAIGAVEAASPEALKTALLGAFPDLAVPATFCLRSEFAFPPEATLLPVAGRKLPPLLWGAPGLA